MRYKCLHCPQVTQIGQGFSVTGREVVDDEEVVDSTTGLKSQSIDPVWETDDDV
jgi:hypothetical protein